MALKCLLSTLQGLSLKFADGGWLVLAISCSGLSAVAALAADGPRPYGIEQRTPWTGSRVKGSPEAPAPYKTEPVFPELRFDSPVLLTNCPNDRRLFVGELAGKIFSFPSDSEAGEPDLAIDLKSAVGAARLYGLTFHPTFPDKPYCYVCYTIGDGLEDGTRLSRFEVSADPPQIMAETEQVVLTWLSGGHNGGCLKFGPDHYLYVSTGDGGPAFPPDPLLSGQDVSNLLSSILRIDVDHVDEGLAYSIPAGNPFVDLEGARGEVWAYGFRNPWKMSFDFQTGDLWVGDVGWELWEMVYRVERAANYGWSVVEGPQEVHRERQRGPTPIVAPTAQHSHIESRSVTGGFVYRGSRLPDLQGSYVYGDYVTGKIWALRYKHDEVSQPIELVDSPLQIICFGVDHDDEIYIVSYDGTLHRLVANTAGAANQEFPRTLSETGLFQSTAEHKVAPGVIGYSINAEPWMDGASAERYVAFPGQSTLDVFDSSNWQVGFIRGHWKYPEDTVFLKTISIQGDVEYESSRRRLETQILHLNGNNWNAYNYIWSDDQTDAVLADDVGSSKVLAIHDPAADDGVRQQTWNFASRTECILCHTARGGSIYGFNPQQLNRDHEYGPVVDNQLRTMRHIGLFDEQPDAESEKIVDPYDSAADLQLRARAYLHINCAHCHRRGGGGTAHIELLYDWPLDKTHLLDARPTQGTFGIHRAAVVAAGDPARSVLFYRLAKLGRGRMPHIGSSVIDDRGLELMEQWIEQLAPDASGVAESQTSARAAQQQAFDRLSEIGHEDPEEEIETLLATTTGALMLATGLRSGAFSDEVATRAIAAGTIHSEAQIRDLFERYLPEQARSQRLGRQVDPARVLSLVGDHRLGKQLFEVASGVQCRNCHKLGDVGNALGPDLHEVAKKQSRAQILQSILLPSKNIEPKYVSQLVETVDGRVFVGIVLDSDDDEKVVTLLDAQNKQTRIPQAEIEFQAPQQKSLMPELLVQDLTAQELANLLAFLTE